MPTPIKAPTTVLDDFPLTPRKRAATLVGGQKAVLDWIVVDADQRPVDLTAYVPSGAPAAPPTSNSANPSYGAGILGPPYPPVLGRLAEAVANSSGWKTIVGEIVDAPLGKVRLTFDSADAIPPAVYECDVGVVDADTGRPDYVNRLSIIVEPSGFAMNAVGSGPPTLREIRLHLRDSSPVESRLLDELQFDDAEIAEAIVHPIEYWNSALPPVAFFDTSNFPYGHQWKNGIIATLYDMASRWYQKNYLTASAGGVTINDMDKAAAYQAMADKLWGEYKQWTRSAKTSISAQQCFGSVGSPYKYTGWFTGLGS